MTLILLSNLVIVASCNQAKGKSKVISTTDNSHAFILKKSSVALRQPPAQPPVTFSLKIPVTNFSNALQNDDLPRDN